MRIAIVGTGAMGSVYASLLGKAGHDVWAIDIWQEHIDAIARDGLAISGASGSYVVDNLSVGSGPEAAGACDVWVIATKAQDVDVGGRPHRAAASSRRHRDGVPERARCGRTGRPAACRSDTSCSASPKGSAPRSPRPGSCTTPACA